MSTTRGLNVLGLTHGMAPPTSTMTYFTSLNRLERLMSRTPHICGLYTRSSCPDSIGNYTPSNNSGTEHHQTPLQLFVGRSLELANSQLTAMQDLFSVREESQSSVTEQTECDVPDWNDEGVTSHIQCPLSPECLQELQNQVKPLQDSAEMGMDLYLNVLNFIADHPEQNS